MKTKIAIQITFAIAFIFINLSVSFGQVLPRYYWKNIPSPTASHLRGVSTYFIVGENGTILYRSGAYTYSVVSGIPNYIFNSVSFFNYNSNYHTVVGNNGVIYYCPSTNQYTNWASQSSGTNANLNSVVIHDTRNPLYTRIAAGNGGTILKSTTGYPINWTSWVSVVSNTTQNLNGIALDTNNAIIVGDNGTILRSTNKGNSWSAVNSGFSNKLNSVYVNPLDFRIYWVTGDNGLILKSTNTGLNWFQFPSGTTSNLKSFTPYLICGTNGVVLKSLDTGNTWSAVQTLITSDLNSITGSPNFYDVRTVGNEGKIMVWDADSSYYFRNLEGNNISSSITNSGIFDQNICYSNTPGFEWPKGSNRYALFSTGLSMAAMVQGQLRQAMASYKGEMKAGRCSNGIPFTNDTFRVYSVKRTDNPGTFDWQNWGLMVPYGAPFVDVNNNGLFEPAIDTPGVKNASQTVFVCMTDGFPDRHSSSEGFGGGTLPLYNEVHLTAWCYSQPTYSDMQFLKYEVINKGNNPWLRTHFSFISDPDLGDANDDYIGCDTVRKLGYCYNSDNMDGNGNPPSYGASPPAVGYLLLKGAYRKYVNPGNLSATAITSYLKNSVHCENEPSIPLEAYYFMMGYKNDSTSWLDPTQSPKKKTKFLYPGDPETNTGWTEYKGSIHNCDNDTIGTINAINPTGDRRLLLHSGSEDLTVLPGDTQRIVLCQLIARGSSNLNSVTKLKQLSDVAINFYNTNFTIGVNQISTEVPEKYDLLQNYPNPFNNTSNLKFKIAKLSNVKIVVYDVTGREIQTLVNQKLQPGTYEVMVDGSLLPSGVYFYRITAGDFSETKRMVLLK